MFNYWRQHPGWPSDGPTAPQLKELLAQIERGQLTKERLQSFLRRADLQYPATVDYDEVTVDQLIKTACLGISDADSTIVQHFNNESNEKAEVKFVLISYDNYVTDQQVLDSLRSRSRRPATAKELLTFAVAYPDEPLDNSIVALGSSAHNGTTIWYPCLGRVFDSRSLRMLDVDLSKRHSWGRGWRFLAVIV